MNGSSNLVCKVVARSARTRPTRKCCCRNSGDSSAKALPRSVRVELDTTEPWDDAMLGQGDVAGEGVSGVAKGRLRVTKCS